MRKRRLDKMQAEEEEREIWYCLYEENKERILALAFHFTRNRQDAEDILQESFVKAFRFFLPTRSRIKATPTFLFG